MPQYFFLIVLLPLVGALCTSLISLTKFIGEKESAKENIVGGFATLMIALPFLFFISLAIQLDKNPAPMTAVMYEWFSAGTMTVQLAYRFDTLSVLMGLIVTGVGSLIHLYSIGYMHGDRDFARFFAYLNLFIFAMLNLILAGNMVLMFLGWEGVGLCSYLLIGFWYDRKFDGVAIKTTTDAANKAFVMNRIGDVAMLAAMFLLFQKLGSLNYTDILAQAGTLDSTHLFWITLLIFIGCTGKSAQIPLYTWLPDAMAGPTPVSALIHAATMVTSGIYLTARLAPMFVLSPETMTVMAILGGATALIAGTIGLAQNDIKKVLAYSTVSQLGYMFMALGVGAFTTAIFHVTTHAFFKACLFLGSGSVIHALHEEQDIRKMGGLGSDMPQTAITFLIASLALAGFPLTAGFFSKDDILTKVFAHGDYVLWGMGIFTAALTAFYTMRLYTLTFVGAPRYAKEKHPHESPLVMTLPLWILAALSLVSGLFGLPAVMQNENAITAWLSHTIPAAIQIDAHLSHTTEWMLLALSGVIAMVGLYAAYAIYSKKSVESPAAWRGLLEKKYYLDEVYNAAIAKPFQMLSEKVLALFDRAVIDGMVNGLGSLLLLAGRGLKVWQNGVVQSYALMIMLGLVVILTYIVFRP
jgi:NADH-quinone oxidoreductase subunit L